MSAPLLTYEGYQSLMGGALASFAAGANAARVRLFKNNLTPTKDSIWTDFVEADFSGYLPIPVPSAVDQGLTPAHIDVWKFAKVTFVISALPQQVVYGYWVDHLNPYTSLRRSLWCQRFDAPFLFSAPGVSLPVTLTPGFRQG